MYTVYKHTNKFNNKVYIGITSQKTYQRWKGGQGYRPRGRIQDAYFFNAIKKYGWTNFEHEILFEGLTKQEAEEKETELILYYHSDERNYGYNIQRGGFSRGKMAESSKHKVSESWNNGREERARKISESKKGVPFSDEHRKHLSESKKGKPARNRRAVNQYDLNMNFIKRWESLEEAQRKLGVCKANICRAIKNDKTAGGFKWTYC